MLSHGSEADGEIWNCVHLLSHSVHWCSERVSEDCDAGGQVHSFFGENWAFCSGVKTFFGVFMLGRDVALHKLAFLTCVMSVLLAFWLSDQSGDRSFASSDFSSSRYSASMQCVEAAVRRGCDKPGSHDCLAESVLQSCTELTALLGPKYHVCFLPGRTVLIGTGQLIYPTSGFYCLSTEAAWEGFLDGERQCMVDSGWMDHLRVHLVAFKSGYCVKVPPSFLCRGSGKRDLNVESLLLFDV
jgi:hypothetical protein